MRWDDEHADWSGYAALVLRSCWDYHLRPAEFEDWLDRIAALGVRLHNSVPVVRWNMHKRYLAELGARGALIPDTILLTNGDARGLSELMRERAWDEAIVKPAISASATDTWRVTAADAVRRDPALRALARRGDVLVQRFVPEITSVGEWSLIFIDGAFSHAVFKKPRAGDFRVQLEHGGSAEPATAPAEIVGAAAGITRLIPGDWLFARIDGVDTSNGFMLMEVEVIEPHLFFAFQPEARRRLAAAVLRS